MSEATSGIFTILEPRMSLRSCGLLVSPWKRWCRAGSISQRRVLFAGGWRRGQRCAAAGPQRKPQDGAGFCVVGRLYKLSDWHAVDAGRRDRVRWAVVIGDNGRAHVVGFVDRWDFWRDLHCHGDPDGAPLRRGAVLALIVV